MGSMTFMAQRRALMCVLPPEMSQVRYPDSAWLPVADEKTRRQGNQDALDLGGAKH